MASIYLGERVTELALKGAPLSLSRASSLTSLISLSLLPGMTPALGDGLLSLLAEL